MCICGVVVPKKRIPFVPILYPQHLSMVADDIRTFTALSCKLCCDPLSLLPKVLPPIALQLHYMLLPTVKAPYTLNLPHQITQCKLSPDGHCFAVSDVWLNLVIRSTATGKEERTFTRNLHRHGEDTALEWSPSGELLAVASRFGEIELFRTDKGILVTSLIGEAGDSIHSLGFNSEEDCLMSASYSSIQIWQRTMSSTLTAADWAPVALKRFSMEKPCLCAALSGSRVVFCYGDVLLWWTWQRDVGEGDTDDEPSPTYFFDNSSFANNPHNAQTCAFNMDHSKIVTTGAHGSICVWDVNTRKVLYSLLPNGTAQSAFFLMGPKPLVIVVIGSAVRLWDCEETNAAPRSISSGRTALVDAHYAIVLSVTGKNVSALMLDRY